MFRKIICTTVTSVFLVVASGSVAEPSSEYSAAQLKEDFAALYGGLASAHFDLYANRSRQEYDALFERMYAELDGPLDQHQARVQFQKFAAFGNVAHARIESDHQSYEAYRNAGGKVFPVYLRIVDGRSYVDENHSGNPELQPAMEIVALNGKPMSAWLDAASTNLSADTPYIAHSILEFMLPMYLWLEAGPVDEFALTVRTEGEASTVINIPALSREQMQKNRDQLVESFALDATSREATMLAGDVAYLRPGPFYNVENPQNPWNNEAFVEFVDDAFLAFIDAGAQQLIIDLRQNPGGDNSFSDPMVAWFATEPFRFASSFHIRSSQQARASNQARLDTNPASVEGASGFFAEQYAAVPYGDIFEYPVELVQPRPGVRFEGDVYVLVNRHSYSNAVTVAAVVQDYGFGTIIGEKTSDMATTYGAMETFALPNTGIVVGFPKAHIIRPSGDRRPDGVTPDVVIQSPIGPRTSDSVLEEALALIGSQ